MKVVSFSGEGTSLDHFVELGQRLRGQQPSPRSERELLLDASAFARDGGELEHFVVDVGEGARARVTASLVPGAKSKGLTTGQLGFFAADSPEAARAVLDRGCEWLNARGVELALGPVNLSTWHDYRAITEGYDNGFFFLEPPCGRADADWFEAAGFVPHAEYATLEIPHQPSRHTQRAHAYALEQGVRLLPFESCPRDEGLSILYDIAKEAFADKAAFRRVSREAFMELYDGLDGLLVPRLSWFATDEGGRPLGFIFAYPDFLGMQKGIRRSVLKTIAVVPQAPMMLGWALTHAHILGAREHGLTTGLYALMENYWHLLSYTQAEGRVPGGVPGRVFKRYALFERDLRSNSTNPHPR